MKRSRFRQRHGLIAWEPRVNNPRVANYMRDRLAKISPIAVTRNSTRVTPPLSSAEYKEVDSMDKKTKGKAQPTNKATQPKMPVQEKQTTEQHPKVRHLSRHASQANIQSVGNSRHQAPHHAAHTEAAPISNESQPNRPRFLPVNDSGAQHSYYDARNLQGIGATEITQKTISSTSWALSPGASLPQASETHRALHRQTLPAYHSVMPSYPEEQESASGSDVSAKASNEEASTALMGLGRIPPPVTLPEASSDIGRSQTMTSHVYGLPVNVPSVTHSTPPPTGAERQTESPGEELRQTFPRLPGISATISDANSTQANQPPWPSSTGSPALDEAGPHSNCLGSCCNRQRCLVHRLGSNRGGIGSSIGLKRAPNA